MKYVKRYPKKFTVKAWKKFDLTQQDILCGRYDIILTDYKTTKEKVMDIWKKLKTKNVTKGITKFNKGMDGLMSQLNTPMEKPKRKAKHGRKSKPKRHYEPELDTMVSDLWGSDNDMNKNIKDLLG